MTENKFQKGKHDLGGGGPNMLTVFYKGENQINTVNILQKNTFQSKISFRSIGDITKQNNHQQLFHQLKGKTRIGVQTQLKVENQGYKYRQLEYESLPVLMNNRASTENNLNPEEGQYQGIPEENQIRGRKLGG